MKRTFFYIHLLLLTTLYLLMPLSVASAENGDFSERASKMAEIIGVRDSFDGDKTRIVIDASKVDDMSEVLGACDILLTDYSAMSFDAAYMHLPVFLYVPDLREYIEERGGLMWELDKLPFIKAETDEELTGAIAGFDEAAYGKELTAFLSDLNILEDGNAASRVADIIEAHLEGGEAL